MTDSIQIIKQDSKVTMHFALRMDGIATDGTRKKDEVDSTFNAKSAEFVLGDGNLLPGFEEFLIGLTTGDQEMMIALRNLYMSVYYCQAFVGTFTSNWSRLTYELMYAYMGREPPAMSLDSEWYP